MAFGDADIGAVLEDLEQCGATVEVTLGGTTAQGLWDHDALEILEGAGPGVVANEKAVHVQASSMPEVDSGASITVAGETYTVREALPYGDGAMIRIALRES